MAHLVFLSESGVSGGGPFFYLNIACVTDEEQAKKLARDRFKDGPSFLQALYHPGEGDMSWLYIPIFDEIGPELLESDGFIIIYDQEKDFDAWTEEAERTA